jgi:tetratricopeptide (TPR) repeat protein
VRGKCARCGGRRVSRAKCWQYWAAQHNLVPAPHPQGTNGVTDPFESLQAVLLPHYELLSQLGTGGMAHVYLATDVRHGRNVAVKVVREELASAIGGERFLREIEITASLSHPHIRPLLDSGLADGRPYYVMPFIKGETLGERLEREGQLGLNEALNVAVELADALAYAHANGVVHRDVKPSNVFISEGHSVLTDFGIALAASSADQARLTETEFVVGTAEYMSPEQADSGGRMDHRTDVYSLGCVLFEMLTGQPPFTGRTRMAVIAKHVSGQVPSAAVLRPDLPIEIEEALERCLAKTPGDRFDGATDLRDALTRARDQWKSGQSRGTAVALRKKRRVSWRARLAQAAVAVLAIGGLAKVLILPDVPPLDALRVVVFPLADRGGAPEGEGTDLAMLLTSALVHADPLRAIDGWQDLEVGQRQDPGLITGEVARRISIANQAGRFITGGVTQRGESVSVLLVLHDSDTNQSLGEASRSGPISDLSTGHLALQALIELLPALLETERPVDLSFLLERDPSAIALWIQGDLEYRQARFTAALTHYGNAVREDSLLSMAALMGAKTASWVQELDLAAELVRVAQAGEDVLPARHRSLAAGLDAYLEGRASRAVESYRSALAADPDWSDAWMLLGEAFQHLLPDEREVSRLAEEAFAEAARLDSGFVQPLVHLSEYALRRGDVAEARSMVERVEASGAEGSARVLAVSAMLDCVEGHMDERRWSAEAEGDPLIVLEAAQQLAVGGAHLGCAESGFRSLLVLEGLERGVRWAAAMGLSGLLMSQGRDDDAGEVLDDVQAAGISTALFVPSLAVWSGADMAARAEGVYNFAVSTFGEALDGVGPLTLWTLGEWKSFSGDVVGLQLVHDLIQTAAAEAGDESSRLMADILGAHNALAAADTTGAIQRLGALRSVGEPVDLFTDLAEPLAAERILLAELLLATGDPEGAFWAASAFDHPQPLVYLGFLARSLELRYQAASALSGGPWAARAAEARTRLERLGRTDLLPPG